MDTQLPYSFWVAEVSTSVSTSTSPKHQRSPRADGQNVQVANQLELAPNSLHISSTKINTNCPWPTVFTNPRLFRTKVSSIQLRAKDAPNFKLGLFVHKILFFRSTTKNLVRFCFSRSATKVTLRVIQGALAGVCVYAAALPCCEDLPPDACVPASSPVHPPCELTSLHVHVERASAHVVIRISLQMRRLALTCAPTANRVDCTNTSQEPENCVY